MKQDMSPTSQQVIFGNDSIVIKKFIAGIEGGKTLDVTSFPNTTIEAGHIIITDGSGTYKPMPLNTDGNAYGDLPSGYSYVGVLYRTILTSKPAAAIMTWGIVNEAVLTFAVPAAFKTAVPHITFTKDEEA